jgi:phage shock protein C
MAVQMPSRLYRSRSEKMIAGVCGGLGEYFDVDPVLIRLLFVVTTLVSGVGLLAYVVLWVLVPRQGDNDAPRGEILRGEVEGLYREERQRIDPVVGRHGAGAGPATEPGAATGPAEDHVAGEPDPIGSLDPLDDPADELPPRPPLASAAPFADPAGLAERRRRRQHWAGAILIVVGTLFLAQNFGLLWWVQARFLVPLILVGVGGWLLFGRSRHAAS